ncbi:MAG: adenylate kinase family protein [Halobacteriota archaeon]
MRIALTGTPGTGKTTISTALRERYGLTIIDVNEIVRAHQYVDAFDDRRNCLIVNLTALRAHRFQRNSILEGHLSHHLDVDRVIVLRTDPTTLERRLLCRGFSHEKAKENVEAEILDVILIEAIALHDDRVYELDSTGALDETAQRAWEITQGQNLERFVPGHIDWVARYYDA